jgi:hypothetical protein
MNRATPRFEILERLPSAALLHQVEPDGTLWGTSGRSIWRRRSGAWAEVARFPFAAPRDFFGFSRPAARATRADKSNLYHNTHGRLLGVRASVVYRLSAGSGLEPLLRINGDCVLHGGICEDDQGWVYLGEYFLNPDRQPARIWRLSPDLDSWQVAHEFPAGLVRHIHGIYRDPFDPAALWVTSGDATGECYLWRTADRFRTLERIGEGSQTWRAVRLFFTRDHICWLTDSHVEQNHACRMARLSGRLEIGQAVEASTWYGSSTTDGLHLAFTTVEPGPAIHRRQSLVLASRDAFHWTEVYAFAKDAWRPLKLFKYGVISCPSGPMTSQDLYLSGEGLRGLDGVTVRARIVAASA